MEPNHLTALGICVLMFISFCDVSNAEVDFDYFVYAQQQPETLCMKTEEAHEKCSIPQNVTTWTVHGLWPSLNDSKGPFNCNTSAKFDPSKIRPIESSLWKFWPNLFPSTKGDVYEFWEHEWYKHGTCAMNLSSTSNEYLYFNTGLKLQAKVNLDKILSDAGIPRSDDITYPLEMVVSELEKAIGKKVIVNCYISHKKQYLFQVEVCMDLKFQYIDCSSTEGNCTKKYQVHYPKIKHPFVKRSNNRYNWYDMLQRL